MTRSAGAAALVAGQSATTCCAAPTPRSTAKDPGRNQVVLCEADMTSRRDLRLSA